MGSNENNKVFGAVLGTLTFLMLVSFGGELLFKEKKSTQAGYDLPMPVAAAAAAVAPAGPPVEPIAIRLASADKERGATVFRQCASCHTPDKGGANKVGPNMWGVVERVKGQVAGFGYSNSLKAIAAKGEKWGYAELDKFVENPRGYIAGTSMSYGGLANPKQRADLIAYLNTLSDSPETLPK